MFKIQDSTIHCSRGDGGTITLKIPITDSHGYVQYEDINQLIYWYDTKNKILYDSDYEVSSVSLGDLTAIYYQFNAGDKITLNVYNKNGYGESPLLSKIVEIEEDSYSVDIALNEEDTTFGKIANKAVVYWYDITLNDSQTIVCYNEDGPKEFIQYPAKGDDE